MFVGKLGTKEKKHFCCVVFLALRGIFRGTMVSDLHRAVTQRSL